MQSSVHAQKGSPHHTVHVGRPFPGALAVSLMPALAVGLMPALAVCLMTHASLVQSSSHTLLLP